MEINVRVEVQFNAPETTRIRDMLKMFRTPMWVRFMVRYIAPHLRNCAPTNHDVLSNLSKRRCNGAAATACVVCMTETTSGIELPCGHVFHQACIESWLKMRSTCPTCRYQLPKAFKGCYAVKTLNSALALRPEHQAMAKDAILESTVGQGPVRAVVSVTLYHVSDADRQQQFPCVLNALLLHTNGDVAAESEPAAGAKVRADADPDTNTTPATPPPPAASPAAYDRRRRADTAFACPDRDDDAEHAQQRPTSPQQQHKRMRVT